VLRELKRRWEVNGNYKTLNDGDERYIDEEHPRSVNEIDESVEEAERRSSPNQILGLNFDDPGF
jgi:hypothetical protein